jgi:hypothetical protein
MGSGNEPCDGWPSKGITLKNEGCNKEGGQGELGNFEEMRARRV